MKPTLAETLKTVIENPKAFLTTEKGLVIQAAAPYSSLAQDLLDGVTVEVPYFFQDIPNWKVTLYIFSTAGIIHTLTSMTCSSLSTLLESSEGYRLGRLLSTVSPSGGAIAGMSLKSFG